MKISIGTKIFIGLIGVLIAVGFAAFTVLTAANQRAEFDAVVSNEFEWISNLRELDINLVKLGRSEYKYWITSEKDSLDNYTQTKEKLELSLQKIQNFGHSDDQVELAQLTLVLDQLPEELETSSLIDQIDQGDEIEVDFDSPNGVIDITQEAEVILDQLIFNSAEKLQISQQQSELAADSLRNYIIFGAISSLTMIFVTMFIIVLAVIRPIRKLTTVIDSISKGDLSVQVDPNLLKVGDELGDLARAFDRTMVSLKMSIKRQKQIEKEPPKEASN